MYIAFSLSNSEPINLAVEVAYNTVDKNRNNLGCRNCYLSNT